MSDTPSPAISSTSEPIEDISELQAKFEDQEEKEAKNAKGGMRFTDPKSQEAVRQQRGVLWALFKSIGSNLMEGRDLVNFSLPVSIFEPRSFLERLTDGWAFLPGVFSQAAKAIDPVRRLQLVATGVIAGLHLKCEQLKPFNPILGETFQAVYSDGSRVFVEQSSHHPPITAWQVVDPNGFWHFYGTCQWKASMRGNTIKGWEAGDCFVSFPKTGEVIKFTMPTISLRGIIWGERVADFCGTIKFEDPRENLVLSFTFNPDVQSTTGFLKSFLFTPAHPSDYFKGTIVRVSPDNPKKGTEVSKFDGSWLSNIVFDNEKFWDKNSKPLESFKLSHVENPLPSDCRFRDDLRTLLTGDLEAAQKEKQRLEEEQRKDKKLRQSGASAAGRKN